MPFVVSALSSVEVPAAFWIRKAVAESLLACGLIITLPPEVPLAPFAPPLITTSPPLPVPLPFEPITVSLLPLVLVEVCAAKPSVRSAPLAK